MSGIPLAAQQLIQNVPDDQKVTFSQFQDFVNGVAEERTTIDNGNVSSTSWLEDFKEYNETQG